MKYQSCPLCGKFQIPQDERIPKELLCRCTQKEKDEYDLAKARRTLEEMGKT